MEDGFGPSPLEELITEMLVRGISPGTTDPSDLAAIETLAAKFRDQQAHAEKLELEAALSRRSGFRMTIDSSLAPDDWYLKSADGRKHRLFEKNGESFIVTEN